MALDNEILAGFINIIGKIFIQSDATEEELELLRQRVDQHCPVLDDLSRPIEVNFAIEKHDPAIEFI